MVLAGVIFIVKYVEGIRVILGLSRSHVLVGSFAPLVTIYIV